MANPLARVRVYNICFIWTLKIIEGPYLLVCLNKDPTIKLFCGVWVTLQTKADMMID